MAHESSRGGELRPILRPRCRMAQIRPAVLSAEMSPYPANARRRALFFFTKAMAIRFVFVRSIKLQTPGAVFLPT